ncbi:MAG: DUF3276 family protein [Spirochaetaceae bacterium]|jgi:hypothetical protein|nr:DUF3276 family protein [Spirochaetaceae bacterium]
MGIRGELFSSKVLLRSRSYFFNIKENRNGDLYFNIVESKNRDGNGFERQSVIVFEEDLQEFLKGFDETLKVFEKETRGRHRQGGYGKQPSYENMDGPDGEPDTGYKKDFTPRKNQY